MAKALGKVVVAYDAGKIFGTDALARVRAEVLPDVTISRRQRRHLLPEVGASLALADRSAGGGVKENMPLLRVVRG